MNPFEEIGTGLGRAWDAVTQGWRELVERAGDALTHFRQPRGGGDIETREEHVARWGARWAVLAAEVSVGDDAVVVSLEVPGMEPEDFAIEVVDDRLMVRGEKRVERESTRGQLRVMERAYGRFERAIALPAAVDGDAATARYRRGVLRVSLPLRAQARARRIPVAGG